MEAYKLWVRKNQDLLRSVESLANEVTWILPERFGNSEIVAEAVYALAGAASCVNQHMLKDGEEQSFPWALVVPMLKYAEGVVEVAAQRFVGDDRKWGFLATTEAVKACCRLAAFRESGYRMLLHGGEVKNEDGYGGVKRNGYYCPQNGHGLDGLFVSNCPEGEAEMMSDPMWMLPSPVTPVMEVEKPSAWSWKRCLFMLGEAFHIFRPLVYVLMISRFGTRSWTPWFVSLAVELTSHMCIRSHLRLSSAERDELKRRKMMLALYAMRDPFFTDYTRQGSPGQSRESSESTAVDLHG
uniref:Uncharacterized protein n=1 Tax=Avena sativa TaxID=4498 RepID=A0ACD5WSZ3_AVESA